MRALHNSSSSIINTPSVHPSLLLSQQNNHWIYQRNENIGVPLRKSTILDQLSNPLKWVPPAQDTLIEAPSTTNTDITKQAARLIIIRRKKMKKHKLRKLRLKMKFEWAKVRQRREWKKEKEFQAGLIAQCKEAEAFSAEEYVQSRINKLNELLAKKEADTASATNRNKIQ